MSTYVSVVISPATTTSPVVTSVSQATRALGSCSIAASRIVSEIWSAILSGCPSVTDSLVKRCEVLAPTSSLSTVVDTTLSAAIRSLPLLSYLYRHSVQNGACHLGLGGPGNELFSGLAHDVCLVLVGTEARSRDRDVVPDHEVYAL